MFKPVFTNPTTQAIRDQFYANLAKVDELLDESAQRSLARKHYTHAPAPLTAEQQEAVDANQGKHIYWYAHPKRNV